MSHETVYILDFGAQYAQLIARRVREHHCYCEIVPATIDPERLAGAKGLILTGGPASVYARNAPRCDPRVFDLGIPVLGICYGMQLMCHELGGKVVAAERREFGHARLDVAVPGDLFHGVPPRTQVWMSHGDSVEDPGPGFETLARTTNTPFAAVRHLERRLWGIQFHPEVTHTEKGREVLGNFLVRICKVSGDWQMGSFIEETVGRIREKVGGKGVVLGLSGGVDSMVVAKLCERAIAQHVHPIFVDNGLLRKNEAEDVKKTFADHFSIPLDFVDASALFLDRLRGVVDPERKRTIIGHAFVEVFKAEAKRFQDAQFLAQGTLYPDVIESVAAHGGPTATIKTHHNVGGLPAELGFDLLEPLRELFKDEVRTIGRALGLPERIVSRHPFPGPGLAVRVLGEITPERLRLLREADDRIQQEIRASGLYPSLWQAFAVLLPVQSVGVMGDERTYEHVVAVRAVTSLDAMTADVAELPYDLLKRISNRIINEVRGINRVAYDISSKPPATIEWE
ncbi:MAG TPA: glutamine-hydrolyzing GMP synthase [Planctomycetota bacterium]|nr:glutamine-hydrolyzing GMP synthase [Planctomycetota bacterium]